jgi:signal transduction histidine kinase
MGSSRFPVVSSRLWAIGLALIGAWFVIIVVRAAGAGRASNYGSVSTLAVAVAVAAGVALISSGTALSVMGKGWMRGIVCSAAGVCWLAAEVVGWVGGAAAVRSVAMVIEVMLLALLAHLGLSYPAGSVGAGPDRILLSIIYGAAVFTAVTRALVYDPFRDLHCWRNCTDNVFLVFGNAALALQLWRAWLLFLVVAGAVAAVRVGRRLWTASPAVRGWSWFVLLPIVGALALEAARPVQLASTDVEDPRVAAFMAVFLGRGLALTAVGLGVGWGVVKMTRTTRSLGTLAEQLGDAMTRGSLEQILARSLGDDTVEVLYWQPDLDRFVDAEGAAAVPARAAGRATTSIERDGQVLGVVMHSPEIEMTDLRREVGSAARLAIDNERLRAGLLAQIDDLRDAQTRIVDAADSSRRRIERDLHDGAQQRLLALSYDIRLARAAAKNDPQTAAALGTAVEKVTKALSDLRGLANGIFPAVLTDGGLGPAVTYLSEGAETPVRVSVDVGRCPSPVEMAGYVVVTEALAAAARLDDDEVRVTIGRSGDDVEVVVDFVGEAPTLGDLVVAVDRIGAVAGTIDLADGTLRTVIPCVS